MLQCVWRLTEEWINGRWSTKQTCIQIHMYSYWVDYMLIYIYIYVYIHSESKLLPCSAKGNFLPYLTDIIPLLLFICPRGCKECSCEVLQFISWEGRYVLKWWRGMEYFLVVFIKTFFGPSFPLAIQITKILNKEDSNLPYYLHNDDVFLLSYLFP